MPDNPQNQSNAASVTSNGPVDNIQEKIERMNLGKKEGDESTQYPDRPGEPDCIYYLRTGLCGYGSTCRFNHPPLVAAKAAQCRSELPQREGQPNCGYYLKTGTCKYGSTCKYHHPLERHGAGQVTLNTLGLPIRQEKSCPYYMRTYTCKFGQACKFNHPQPTSFEAALPESAGIGTMAPALPSNGVPYVGALPAWLSTRSSYVAPSQVPDPQTYIPHVYPLQGPVATQGWKSYAGNLSPVSAPGMMGPNLVYNYRSQGELLPNGTVDLSTVAISNLPERPDQRECRYFMNTGSCKYGSNCKFHHPKERITHNLGPHGLPLRPGEDVCAHFSSYGVCRYGSSCKFNHPIFYPSYYFGMPAIPVLDQSFFPNPRNLAVPNSTETSQLKSRKITDCIQKPEAVADQKRQASVTNPEEHPHEPVEDDCPKDASAPTSSDLPRDQSD